MGSKSACRSGTRKGVDHFREGTIPYSELAGSTLFPVGFTLDEMFDLFWNVREWRVEGSVSWHDLLTDDSDTVDVNESTQDPYTSDVAVAHLGSEDEAELQDRLHFRSLFGPVADERFLPCSYGPISRWIAVDPEIPLSTLIARLYAVMQFTDPNLENRFKNPAIGYDEVNDLFYPLVAFTVSAPFRAGGFTMSSTTGFSSPVVGSIVILGKTVDLRLAGPTDPDDVDISGSFNLVPKKWWEFANSVGDPIFNESTGVQENEAFS